jgi:hypothetical protein
MCNFDVEDPSQFWKEEYKTARKQYECEVCGGKILPGQKYHIQTSLYDGSWDRFRACLRCGEASDEFADRHGGKPTHQTLTEELHECLMEEPESKEWIGKFFVIKEERDDEFVEYEIDYTEGRPNAV